MEIRIALQYNYGYSWVTGKGISVKGFIYNERNEILRDARLLAYFEDVRTEDDFKAKLEKANGLFSVIIQREDQVFFAVDITRTFPLFYALKQKGLIISDAAEACSDEPLQFEGLAKNEFLFTGYVTGSRTLLSGVSQVQAGVYIAYKEQLKTVTYHLYMADEKSEQSFEVLSEQLAGLFDEVGKRMVSTLNGRTALVPLSGGYDSRLIAVLLKRQNYPKVICFTYGIPSSSDVRLSEKVARQLGFPWHFVPYTEAVIGDFLDTPAFREYFRFAANYTSMFFTQDYFALRYLKEKSIIPDDSVVVPGHTGDFLAGGHLMPGLTQQNVRAGILKRHYVLRKGDSTTFQQNITTIPDALPFESFENWNMKERQAKFIINSNRNYEFWGYEHLIPLWDKELVHFFGNVSLEYRTGRKLFDQVLFRYFFQPKQVAFYKEDYPLVIRKVIGARNRLRRVVFSDNNNFKLIARHFENNMPLNVAWSSKDININSIQTTWYITWLEKNAAIR